MLILKTNNYDILDLSKIILSIIIVAIHSNLLSSFIYPWCRIAVPLFFIISSFLLFDRINKSKKDNHNNIIKKYVYRQLQLYGFWFIVLLPITIYLRRAWFSKVFLLGVLEFIKNLLFSSTFFASWFIPASIIGVLIIYYLSKRINNYVLFICSMIVYVMCCIISSYYPLFDNYIWIKDIYNVYSIFLPSPVFSFPAALIWIIIGKMISDGTIKNKNNSIFISLILLIILLLILYTEWLFVYKVTKLYNTDCYIMLVPVCIIIFKLLLNTHVTLKNPLFFRRLSTITYVLHGSIIVVVKVIIKHFIVDDILLGIFLFIITITIVYIIGYTIIKLSSRDKFDLLKLAY